VGGTGAAALVALRRCAGIIWSESMTRDEIIEMRERLAEERAELLEDIERRERQIFEEEAAELARQQREANIVKKDALTYVTRQPAPPPFDDDLLDAVSGAMDEIMAPLVDRVIKLEGQVEVLLALQSKGRK
jgi:hypothetical protein